MSETKKGVGMVVEGVEFENGVVCGRFRGESLGDYGSEGVQLIKEKLTPHYPSQQSI